MNHPPCICEREGQVSAGAWRPASSYIPRTCLRARGVSAAWRPGIVVCSPPHVCKCEGTSESRGGGHCRIPPTRLQARGGVGGMAAGHRRMFPPHVCKCEGMSESRGGGRCRIPPTRLRARGGVGGMATRYRRMFPPTRLRVRVPHTHLRAQGWGPGVFGVAVCVVVYTLNAFASAARRRRIFPPPTRLRA